ncbi:hypothetical protein [Pseudoroseicyclus aestuarii]|uniref:Uncharacterized protein n=1 Tax=Pseudoroseicyclus aestuarii TaxID=1795041 RepID=A0A318SSZ4_9RHOB|nr:hypothetical protein [Pseudoroseicyclus aestuarii]PYE81247.1 hypothetical protein DFP88_10737 [Pseudoroseicyclus aestuarii]
MGLRTIAILGAAFGFGAALVARTQPRRHRPLSQYQPEGHRDDFDADMRLDRGDSAGARREVRWSTIKPGLGTEALDLEAMARVNRRNARLHQLNERW